MGIPVLEDIVRQHAEQAAFLWAVYDHALLHPEENEEMDEERIARVVERLDAHLDGLRVASAEGLDIAKERFDEFPEPGELFVLRMLQPGAEQIKLTELDLDKVRAFLRARLGEPDADD